MILPLSNFIGNSDGEERLWKYSREYLPDDYVSFHNYVVAGKEMDVIALVPNKGILVIEIKDILARNISAVPDNKRIVMKNGTTISSPYFNARKCSLDRLYDQVLVPNGLASVYVVPVVMYTSISEQEFYAAELNKIASRDYSIVKDDLSSQASYLAKIDSIFMKYYEANPGGVKQQYGFNGTLLNKVGNLISTNFRNEEPEHDEYICSNQSDLPEVYSRLIYSPDGSEFTSDKIKSLFDEWHSGTSLQIYITNNVMLEKVHDGFVVLAKESGIPEKIGPEAELPFRLVIQPVKGIAPGFSIENGENYKEYSSKLEWLNNNSSFNYGQYQMEHAALTNIIVKAGAGTGKTFSLISRINYLIWKEKVTPEELPKFLIMITFTNASTDTMEDSLFENFSKLFRLTNNILYQKYLEYVRDIKIATIDSLSRRVISKYASKLGLGKNFSIVTGKYRRSQIVRDNLNKYFEEHPDEINEIRMSSMYRYEKALCQLLEKFESKNVDLSNSELSFGTGDKALSDDMIEILKESQIQLDKELKEENSICLGDLVRKLRTLSQSLSSDDFRNGSVKYLFIDEFQDTDDVQINLVKAFQQKAGFKFFVVGDVKQSIYRFRGADDVAFDTLKKQFDGDEIEEISLRKNYRTGIKLLNEMNEVFAGMDANKDIPYSGEEVLIGTRNFSDDKPFVKIEYNGEIDASNLIPVINEALEQAKAISKSTVAILVRYNWEVEKIVEICRDAGVAVETDTGGRLFKVDPTIDLYKLLLALRYNSEPEYLFNLYTTSFVKDRLPKVALHKMQETGDLLAYFYGENCPIPNWTDYLADLKRKPVLSVLQTMILRIKPWEIFAAKATASDSNAEEYEQNRLYYLRNLDQLFEKLVETSNTQYLTISKLVDYLEIMISTRQEEEEREQFGVKSSDIKLLCTTVHKAKGIEYTTVILPYCNDDYSGRKKHGEVDAIYSGNKIGYRIADKAERTDQESRTDQYDPKYINNIYSENLRDEIEIRKKEEMRILYVAMTRAQHKLYCFLPKEAGAVTWASRLKG